MWLSASNMEKHMEIHVLLHLEEVAVTSNMVLAKVVFKPLDLRL